MTTAELSRFLFSPVVLVLYTSAMLAYLYAMAFGTVDRDDVAAVAKGRRARVLGTGLAIVGVASHVAHLAVRMVAAERLVPLGNMFEFSNVIALVVVVGGLLVVQRRMGRPELMGFVLLGALVTLGMAALLYAEPGPLAPILDSWWLNIHVSTIALAAGIFTMGAVFNGLQLLRDTAERRVALRASGDFGPNTVGAAQAPVGSSDVDAPAHGDVDGDADDVLDSVGERIGKDDGLRVVDADLAYRDALRDVLAQRVFGLRFPWKVGLVAAALALAFSLVFQDVVASVTFPLAMLAMVGIAWWAVPFLPSASALDSLAYRTIAFGFPIWTFAVITGAIWAEQSWGRYWGWDPKETSAFLTWIAYAGYLHARATKGFKGRRAAWVGLGSFGVLLFTYYVVNLLISGLHSYAGLQ